MQRDLEVIRSRTNSCLKRVRAALAGRGEGELVLEGERLVLDAIQAGVLPSTVLVGESRSESQARLAEVSEVLRLVDDDLLAQASGLKTAPGVIALADPPAALQSSDLPLVKDTLVLCSAGVSDPGNLGALARSAEAAGASALVHLGGAHPWNSKALRGSMGSLLRLPVLSGRKPEHMAQELSALGFRHVIASTRGGASPTDFDWTGRIALWVGSETGQLPEPASGFEEVTIPMNPRVESLNVTVAASVLLFAAQRVPGGSG